MTWIIFRVAATNDDRESNDFNQSLFEPFLNYNLPNGWYLIADPIMTANWDAKKSSDRWTVPLGSGVASRLKSAIRP